MCAVNVTDLLCLHAGIIVFTSDGMAHAALSCSLFRLRDDLPQPILIYTRGHTMSIINIDDLTFAYEGGDNIFEHVSFRIDTDWRLGFTGRNGRGKTTFLRLLRGEYEYGGTITASVDFEYFPYRHQPGPYL